MQDTFTLTWNGTSYQTTWFVVFFFGAAGGIVIVIALHQAAMLLRVITKTFRTRRQARLAQQDNK